MTNPSRATSVDTAFNKRSSLLQQESTSEATQRQDSYPEDLGYLLKSSNRPNTERRFSDSSAWHEMVKNNPSTPTTSTSSPLAQSAGGARASYLTRKAHRFSSLKKKKPSSTLLNRLFCSSPNNHGSMDSLFKDDDDDDEVIVELIASAPTEDSSADENRHPELKDSCASGFTQALHEASENLTLHAESHVRNTIQISIQDALLDACSATASKHSSPPTRSSTFDDMGPFEMNEEKKEENSNRKQSRDGCDSTPGKESTPNYKPMRTPGGLVIPTPFLNGGKSLFPSTIDRVFCRPAVDRKSPPPNRSPNRIPESIVTKTKSHSGFTSPPVGPAMEEPCDSNNMTFHETEKNSTTTFNVTDNTPRFKNTITDMGFVDPSNIDLATDRMFLLRMIASQEDLSTVKEVSMSKENDSITVIDDSQRRSFDDDEAFLPDDFKTMVAPNRTSSEYQRPTDHIADRRVKEAVETAQQEMKTTLENQIRKEVAQELKEAQDIEQGTWKAMLVNQIRKELEQEHEKSLQAAMAEYKIQSEQLLREHTEQWSKEHQEDIQQLKAKYDRKVTEQIDKAALAIRTANLHKKEIETMEATITSLKHAAEHSDQSKEVERLRLELQRVQCDKQEEMERIRLELSQAMTSPRQGLSEEEFDRIRQELSEELASNMTESSDKSELEMLKKSLAIVKEELAERERELASSLSASELRRAKKDLEQARSDLEYHERELKTSASASEELEQVRRELEEVKVQLSVKDNELKATSKIKGEVDELKKKLELKEKELAAAKTLSPDRRLSTPGRIQKQPTPTKSTAGRSPTRPSSGRKSERDAELHEREKEALRKQIVVLEGQATKASEEHERALQELRRASEDEILRVKKEMESRVAKYADKERELQETLAEVGSHEKEDLLEQIERLEAEKKSDRVGGLREVQKKEDLLQKIAILEKKEKQLVLDHERAMQDLRARSDSEIQNLRQEIEKQEVIRWANERELRDTISQTSSYEKVKLMEKIEQLEAKLENECKCVVLLNMKLANAEKEVESATRKHHEATEIQKSKNDAEIRRLRKQLENYDAIEEAMQIATNERFSTQEEAQKLKSQLQEMRHHHDRQLEQLKKEHAEELDRLSREANGKLSKVDVDLSSRLELLRKEFESKNKLLQEESRSRVSTIQAAAKQREDELLQELRLKSQKAAEIESALRRQLGDHENGVESQRIDFQKQLDELKKVHEKELDDLLAQLDLVEKEHQDQLAAKEKETRDHDSLVAALSSQLVEAQARVKKAEDLRQKIGDELEQAKLDSKEQQGAIAALRKELQTLQTAKTKLLKEADIAREKACEDAREEMIQRAQEQFKQANELYIKLKKQYDVTKAKAVKLEKDLQATTHDLETERGAKEGRETELNAEYANLQAKFAKLEAESFQKAKEYRHEMAGLLQAAKDFESKLKDQEDSGRSLQKALATVVAEKDKLQVEYDEMKTLSEELMQLVESQQQHEC